MAIDRNALRDWLVRLREILNHEWDPIGVDPGGDGTPEDEYDTYRDVIAGMIASGAVDAELMAYLRFSERETMGLGDSRDLQRADAELQRVISAIRALGPPPRTLAK